ncbi:MAG TPA: hypothetical protein VK421_15450 [Pyrinomonadaceae bacterium]|nr:hypothetical protein [Pyrinomonadaceae bacterium]
MSTIRANTEEADASRRKIFVIIALVTALVVAGLVYWATRPGGGGGEQPRLEGAFRAGSPEFAQAKDRVVVEFIADQDAYESTRAVGDIVMTLRPKVRNFTGRTLSGLELKATVVDLEGRPVRERTVIAIPSSGRAELENNRVAEVPIMMEGFAKEDVRANVRVEVTGVRFKQ